VDLGEEADPSEVARWVGMPGWPRVALDDALMGLLAAHSIPPPAMRELYAPWKVMLASAHEREPAPG
jgi:hypothetical protein